MKLFQKKQTKLSFEVNGMHCEGCVSRVQHLLSQLPGIRQVTVNLEPPLVVLTTTKAWTLAQLNAELQKAGEYELKEHAT